MSLDKWKHVLGNFDNLQQSIVRGNTSNCYIFETADVSDSEQFFVDFAKAVLCEKATGSGCDNCKYCKKIENNNYEDIYYIIREKGEIKVSEIRSFLSNMNRKSLAKDRNIGVIFDADFLNRFSQNALLKELEEPNNDNMIILFVQNRENLLQTVRSRGGLFRLNAQSREVDSCALQTAKDLLGGVFSNKPFYQWNSSLMEYIESNDAQDSKKAMENLLNAMLAEIKSVTLKNRGNPSIVRRLLSATEYIEETRKELEYNTKIEFAIRKLLFKIGDNNE